MSNRHELDELAEEVAEELLKRKEAEQNAKFSLIKGLLQSRIIQLGIMAILFALAISILSAKKLDIFGIIEIETAETEAEMRVDFSDDYDFDEDGDVVPEDSLFFDMEEEYGDFEQ